MNVDQNQLRQAARQLNIPCPNEENAKKILEVEGVMLVRQLEEAAKGSQRATAYIRGVLLACHESTLERLKEGGMSVPSIRTMVTIGKTEGPDFSVRVKEWHAAGCPDGGEARYIRLTLARHLEAERKAQSNAEAAGYQAPSRPVGVSMPNPRDYRPGRSTVTDHPPQSSAPRQASASVQQPTDSEMDSRPAPPDFDEPHPARNPQNESAASSSPQAQRREHAQRQDHGDAGQQQRQQNQNHQQPTPDGQQHDRQRARSSTRSDDVQVDTTESADAYLSQHIYGGKAAACFSADVTRGKVHTVRLEAAEANAARQYDWQRKIAIQLSQRELPLVLGVLMQWIPKFEGKGHGENNSKWFSLENQGNKLYLVVQAKGQTSRAIPIMPGDGYPITTLLIRQMLKNDPFLNPEILLSLVRKEAALFVGQPTTPARQEQQSNRAAA